MHKLTGLTVHKEGHRYMHKQEDDHKQIERPLVKGYSRHSAQRIVRTSGSIVHL